jgi:hypothetical protein
MHRRFHLLESFCRDDRGAFAVIFAVMAIVLVAFGGSVVDYVALQQTRSRAQLALDAAALALQPQIFDTAMSKEQIRVAAERLMTERIAGEGGVTAYIPNDGIIINVQDGSLYLKARMTVPTMFVSLVGITEMNAQIETEATRKKLALEVVMVLDNSGSMLDQNRMKYLKEAARCATNTLFYSRVIDDPSNSNTCIPAAGASQLEEVKVGIVPFTMFVNVGADKATASWIDRTGISPISDDNFINVDANLTKYNGAVSRLAMFNMLGNGEKWSGCVEARPHLPSGSGRNTLFYDTDDTPATPGNPSSLFVPMFNPDMPSGYDRGNYTSDSPASCKYTGKLVVKTVHSSCVSKYSNCADISTTKTLTGLRTGKLADDDDVTCTENLVEQFSETSGARNKRYTRTRTWTCNSYKYDAQGLTDLELHQRICKYDGASFRSTPTTGPNAECIDEPILPLTNVVKSVTSKIDAMVALGGTNIHEGTVWGFRVLSPGEPFAEGGPYDEATSKVMIIMTDGENTQYNLPSLNYCSNATAALNGSCYNSAYGWPRNHTSATPRMGPFNTSNAELVRQMNERTSQTCANAKAEGITVYTIGLATNAVSQSTQATVEKMLRECATSPDRAHLPKSPTELKAVFQRIANDLSALRLAL